MVVQEADTIREGALAEAESRIRAAEHRAADAVAQSLAQVAAAEQLAEARVRDAESARSASIALISALQVRACSGAAWCDSALRGGCSGCIFVYVACSFLSCRTCCNPCCNIDRFDNERHLDLSERTAARASVLPDICPLATATGLFT